MSELAERIADLSPKRRALLALRLMRKLPEAAGSQTISRRTEQDTLPLSFNQEGLWFLDQLEPDSPRFCLSGTLRLKGELNVNALRESINEIIKRHEALRTTFKAVGEELLQFITPVLRVDLPVEDLRHLSEPEREATANELTSEEALRPFNLEEGPLLRVMLLRIDDEEHIMLLTMHHIVSDGWSLLLFIKEMAAFYESLSTGVPVQLSPLPIQYADFARWQRQRLQGAILETQLAYWQKQLGGRLPVLSLPTDRPRPPIQTYWSADQSLTLPPALFDALKNLGHQTGNTLFMTLLAAFQALLHRYTGQDDIIVGSPIAGRRWSETEEIIGYFVNMLPLRLNFSDVSSFRELLKQARDVVLEAYAHQDLPFSKIVAALQPERDLSRSPIFQVVFILLDALPTIKLSGLTLTPLQIDMQTVKYDLIMFMQYNEEGLHGLLMYNKDLFDEPTISRMLTHFKFLLEEVVSNPDQNLLDISLTAEASSNVVASHAASSDADEETQFVF
jgi:hypothetical protein